jgi:predicted ferric reductase
MATVATRAERRPASPPPARRTAPSPPTPAPRPWVLLAAITALGVGFGATLALGVTAETSSQLHAAGGAAMFLGSMTGLAGTYLALVMVLLVSRVPVVERVLGQDRLVRTHRRLAPWPLSLIAAHVFLITVGYAQAAHTGVWHEAGVLVSTFPDMLTATIGFALMMAIGLVSIRAIRQRIPRERWWALHLCMYLALALSFAHVIALGPSFVNHPLTQLLWGALWLATAGLVLAYRVGLPVVRTLRHNLRVVEVRHETADVVSIVLEGRRLDRLAVSGGQFFEWRFLARGMWWQAHPFSISALPRPPYLRLTVKGVGDFSAALRHVGPGTKVAIEGPYGTFTRHAQTRTKVVLVAGGIGVTAVRSLLEDLPRKSDPVVVLRASDKEDLVLSEEVAELARQRKGRVVELVGPRSLVSLDQLVDLVPDLRQRDVFVAGPASFVHRVVATASRLGVPDAAIHFEVYEL